MSGHFEITHESDVARYERHLEEPKRGCKTEAEVFGKTFLNAFLDEYGISPIRLADVATILAEDAHQQQRNVIVRSKEDLRSRLSTQGYSKAEIDGLFRHFLLPRGLIGRWLLRHSVPRTGGLGATKENYL